MFLGVFFISDTHGLDALAAVLMMPLDMVQESRDHFVQRHIQSDMGGEEVQSMDSLL